MIEQIKLERVINGLSKIEENETQDMNSIRAKFCKEFIERVMFNDIKLSEVCPFNYYHLGHDFKNFFDGTYKEDFSLFYICCVRFLKEYLFYLSRIRSSDMFARSLWNYFEDDNLTLLDERCKRQAHYIKTEMGVDMLNFYFGEKGFRAFLDYSENLEQADLKSEVLKQHITNEENRIREFLNKKQAKVDLLANNLDEQKTAFNFVGLSQGFENLLSKKNKAKWASFILMVIVFLLLVLVPFSFIGGRFLNWFSEYNITWNEIGWEHMLPILGLELLLVYFFRVVLSHYNSVQTQIMQLELRNALCQFIQNYADYAKDIKEKDSALLEKFESLIFSSILSSADKVPSTFDGLEQMSNLIKSIKSGN